MDLKELYRRWRHRHGYGVHSPFAYRLITEVLWPRKGYAYYGEQRLAESHHSVSTAEMRTAGMLLRLAATLDVGSAFIHHSTKEKLYADALKNANSRMAITSAETLLDNSRLIITEGSLIGLDELRQLLERPGRIIFIENAPATRAEEIFESLDEGLMLNGKRDILIISRPHMQKVRYSI